MPVLFYRQRQSSATAALVRVEISPDDPAIDKIFATGAKHSNLDANELAKLHRTATISSYWARVRIALYQGQKLRFIHLMALGLWRYPDSFAQGFLLQFIWRKFKNLFGVSAGAQGAR